MDEKVSESRLGQLRRRTMTRVVAGLGGTVAALVALGAAILAGGPEPVPAAAPGQSIDSGRWQLSVAGARYVPGDANATIALARQNSLVVDLMLTNQSASSSNSYMQLVSLDPAVSPDIPTFILARDKGFSSDLHPGMTEHVVVVWKWPDRIPAPSDVRLLVAGQAYKKRDNLYGAPGWFDRDPVAAVAVPVQQVQAGGQ